MTQEHCVIDAICENIMERPRRTRRGRLSTNTSNTTGSCNRAARRKFDKDYKRKVRIQNQVITLLGKCPASIVDEVFSVEQVEVIKEGYKRVSALELDYYPIPKRIHNAIRRYAHIHKDKNVKTLLGFVSDIVIAEWNIRHQRGTFEDVLRRLAASAYEISLPIW